MKTHLTTFLAVAILGGASHAWAQKPQPTVLTNAQLKALLSKGLTVKITGADRPNTAARTGTAVYQQDGTVRFNEGASTTTHIGSWRIDGDKFCTKYTNLGSGCFNVQKTGETTYKLIPLDGLLEGTWEVGKK
jgi:hypothetical protein